jgi:hypothetical protein
MEIESWLTTVHCGNAATPDANEVSDMIEISKGRNAPNVFILGKKPIAIYEPSFLSHNCLRLYSSRATIEGILLMALVTRWAPDSGKKIGRKHLSLTMKL